MKILVLGDIHGRWKKVQNIICQEFPGGNGIVLSVGDLEEYPQITGAKLYFVYGNHEDLDKIKLLKTDKSRGLIPIFTGDLVKLPDGTEISGICGNFSPKFYPTDVKNKYIKKHEIEKIKNLKTADILLSHEAPLGVNFLKFGKDLGLPMITEVIEKLKPKIAFFGHHHMYFETVYKQTKIIGLDYPRRSYVILETDDFSVKKVMALSEGGEYTYPWERS